MFQKIINICFIVLLIISIGYFIWSRISEGEDSSRIIDLGNTITELREGNKQLKNTVEEYEREISEFYSQLECTVNSAGASLREVIKTVQRLKKLSEQIEN